MPETFRRKPNRKTILRSDKARHSVYTEEDFESAIARSTHLKKDPVEHRQRADAVGCVVGAAGNYWLVEEKSRYEWPHNEPFTVTHTCVAAGVITTANAENESLIAVGDWVEFANITNETDRGVILHVQQRRTRLYRQTPSDRSFQIIVANVDLAYLVHAAAQPHFSTRLLDRHLIAAEQGGITPVIVLNKIDLIGHDRAEQLVSYYRDHLNICTFLTSVISGDGIDELRDSMSGMVSVFVGASGVGKSSLLNACFGEPLQVVREISSKHNRGRHTTTSARLFHLPSKGALIDTPGLKEFALADLGPEDLAFYFHDFDPYYKDCRYLPCSHTHEPDCAVRKAVEQGKIPLGRYESYTLIFNSFHEY